LEKQASYLVEITPEATQYYLNLLSFLYQTHSSESADEKSEEMLALVFSLSDFPNRGRKEEELEYLGKEHQFLVYSLTNRKTVKVIYFVEESIKKVYITDFFPTEMSFTKMKNK
jgi:plasmid stabilization system protein ParE